MRGRRAVDEMGNRHGRLEVISRAHKNLKGVHWLCRCDCGNVVTVLGRNLRKGHSQSCGCLQRERASLPSGEAAFNAIYYTFRKNAKRRGLEICLSRGQFRATAALDCYYCGGKPTLAQWKPDLNGGFLYNGIDRLNRDAGYTVENVVPCCWPCNKLKGSFGSDEFLGRVEEIYRWRNNGGDRQ